MTNTIKTLLPASLIQWLKHSQTALAIRDAFAPPLKRLMLREASHDQIYGEDYFAMIEQTSDRSARIMANSIIEHLSPGSVIDVGCGTGSLIGHLKDRGVEVLGVECARAALRYCWGRGLEVMEMDLTNPAPELLSAESFDLAISLEVAHQLPPDRADALVAFLGARSNRILFSADSSGDDRLPLNPKPPTYWIKKFRQAGFAFDDSLSALLKREWELHQTAPWFHRYPMVFERIS